MAGAPCLPKEIALTNMLMQAASFRVYARDVEKEAEGNPVEHCTVMLP